MRNKEDEMLAKDLLSDWLERQGYLGSSCDFAPSDPPDLVIAQRSGEQWGIEVTQVFQQVADFPKPASAPTGPGVPSASVVEPLKGFAKELGEKTKKDRRFDYVLYFEGPGLFSTWKISNKSTLKGWKADVEKIVRDFIQSGQQGIVRFPGGHIEAKCSGTGWRIMIGHSIAELGSAIDASLCRALVDKARGLPRWNGTYAKKFLLLLNAYVMASDIQAIEDALHRIAPDLRKYPRFDGVFWSGDPDRTIIRIDL